MNANRVNPRSAVFILCALTVLLAVVHLMVAL
jgi:preprotein translocase subunit Sec61beta